MCSLKTIEYDKYLLRNLYISSKHYDTVELQIQIINKEIKLIQVDVHVMLINLISSIAHKNHSYLYDIQHNQLLDFIILKLCPQHSHCHDKLRSTMPPTTQACTSATNYVISHGGPIAFPKAPNTLTRYTPIPHSWNDRRR